MAKWVPLTALFGLVSLMVIPTPGVVGILIGSVCTLAIIVSAVVMAIDRLAGRLALRLARRKQRRVFRRPRGHHAHSGIARKT
ncbi:hypothetical protein FPV16_13100 [Methylobacterium sp. W2]|uniref:hypothetical protein n=1 Tax=Methylobacterium sp. W2 TaxID=2598107 RepID=UPI001D0C7FAF|nr:hypothetical protein [Methylobacterium sp. W2]MCC0807156.1 hypothetical protein [Methylobacterium sp. W2]